MGKALNGRDDLPYINQGFISWLKNEVSNPSIFLGRVPKEHPLFYRSASVVMTPDEGLKLVYGDKLIKV